MTLGDDSRGSRSLSKKMVTKSRANRAGQLNSANSLIQSDFDDEETKNKTLNDAELFGDKAKRESTRDFSPNLEQNWEELTRKQAWIDDRSTSIEIIL